MMSWLLKSPRKGKKLAGRQANLSPPLSIILLPYREVPASDPSCLEAGTMPQPELGGLEEMMEPRVPQESGEAAGPANGPSSGSRVACEPARVPDPIPPPEGDADGLDMLEEMKVTLHEGSKLARVLGDALREVGRAARPGTKVMFTDFTVVSPF